MDVSAPTHPTTWSITIRRPARNSRCSSAAGVATMPSITMLAASRRTTFVASGAPISAQNAGAAATATSASITLDSVASVATVGAISRGDPGHRTIARLTPSSLKLRKASSASRATAKVPNSSGPRIRASATPIASVPSRPSRVLSTFIRSAPAARAKSGG